MTRAFLYKWTELSSGKWYIGSRTAKGCHENDGYICSSKVVKPLIIANPNNWVREILVVGNNDYIAELEEHFLIFLNAKDDKLSYNRTNSCRPNATGMTRMHNDFENIFVKNTDVAEMIELGWTIGFSQKTKTKMSKNHADMSGFRNPMYGAKRKGKDNPFYGHRHCMETIEQLRRPKTEEHKKKLSVSKRGSKNAMFGKKQKTQQCQHCGKETSVNSHARWHGNNCRLTKDIDRQHINKQTSTIIVE